MTDARETEEISSSDALGYAINRILIEHDMQMMDATRGYPVDTQRYFTVNQIKRLIASQRQEAANEASWNTMVHCMLSIEAVYNESPDLVSVMATVMDIKQRGQNRLAQLRQVGGEKYEG